MRQQLDAMENHAAHMEFGLSMLAARTAGMDEQLRSLTMAVRRLEFAVDGLAADSAEVLRILRKTDGGE